MATVSGCLLPEHLYYDVPNHIWYEPLASSRIRMGLTPVAAGLADNRIFAFSPKRIGRDFDKGKSFATIESSKWVGPARAAFDGVVIETNDNLIDRPSMLVRDPYGAGWMIIAEPRGADPLAPLVTGGAAITAYSDWMRDNNFAGCRDVIP
jgi:glycine cleavage system H protein